MSLVSSRILRLKTKLYPWLARMWLATEDLGMTAMVLWIVMSINLLVLMIAWPWLPLLMTLFWLATSLLWVILAPLGLLLTLTRLTLVSPRKRW